MVLGGFDRLRGHVARANPVWQALSETDEALVVFQGPQAYVSPNWYPSKHQHGKAVPTWNYAAVHVYGVPRRIEDPARTSELLDRLVANHERGRDAPWRSELPESFRAGLEAALVGFELEIDRIEGKFKLNQNQSAADQRGALAGLRAEGRAEDLVSFWESQLKSSE